MRAEASEKVKYLTLVLLLLRPRKVWILRVGHRRGRRGLTCARIEAVVVAVAIAVVVAATLRLVAVRIRRLWRPQLRPRHCWMPLLVIITKLLLLLHLWWLGKRKISLVSKVVGIVSIDAATARRNAARCIRDDRVVTDICA